MTRIKQNNGVAKLRVKDFLSQAFVLKSPPTKSFVFGKCLVLADKSQKF